MVHSINLKEAKVGGGIDRQRNTHRTDGSIESKE